MEERKDRGLGLSREAYERLFKACSSTPHFSIERWMREEEEALEEVYEEIEEKMKKYGIGIK